MSQQTESFDANRKTGQTPEPEKPKKTETPETLLGSEIERRSFAIITRELGGRTFDPFQEPVIKRCIHASADFDYAENLVFSKDAVPIALQALKAGVTIVTDTQMALAGINKTALSLLGGQAFSFISDADVMLQAKERGITRSAASMEKAARLKGPLIFAIGNAPTALIRLKELIEEGAVNPVLVIAAPVGFVNVELSKEMILQTDVPHIVAKGRKGGSSIAAAICNALLFMCREQISYDAQTKRIQNYE